MLEPSPSGESQDVMNNSPQPFIYVCVVSEFNLPEYEACLTLRPQHLVLVVSSFPKLRKASERLVNVLREGLPNTTIHRPDEQQQFDGENILELQTWIAEALRPCIAAIKAGSHKDLTLVFNATGGTKAIGMGLLTRMPWDEVHYKGITGSHLQRLALINNEWVSRGEPLPMKTAAPLDIAHLYADKVEQQSIGLEGQEQHAELAQQLWQALDEQEAAIEALFGWLDELWSQGRDNPEYKQNQLKLTLPEALQTPQVVAWIERLSSLDANSFDLNGQQLSLPGNNPKKSRKAVRKWISGDWLEQLTHHWLLGAGVLAEEMARGVVVNPEQKQSSDGNREADVFVHLKGRSYLIEIKADVPPETPEKSIEQQLESMGDRFGKTTKILMVGPHFRRTLEEKGRWDIFKAKLAANGTRLCDSRASLLKALGLS